jgi:hypothetical protein
MKNEVPTIRIHEKMLRILTTRHKGFSADGEMAVLGIRDILVKVRVRGSVPLTNGSGSGSNSRSDSTPFFKEIKDANKK